MNGLILRQIFFIIWALLDSEHGDNEKDKSYGVDSGDHFGCTLFAGRNLYNRSAGLGAGFTGTGNRSKSGKITSRERSFPCGCLRRSGGKVFPAGCSDRGGSLPLQGSFHRYDRGGECPSASGSYSQCAHQGSFHRRGQRCIRAEFQGEVPFHKRESICLGQNRIHGMQP